MENRENRLNSDDSYTFDRSGSNQMVRTGVLEVCVEDYHPAEAQITSNLDTTSSASLGTGWCRKCSASAKMTGNDPKSWKR